MLTRMKVFILCGLILALGGSVALTQQGGNRGRGGMPSPDERFAQIAGKSDSFDVAKVEIPKEMIRFGDSADKMKEGMTLFLQKRGVTNGIMTKELYRDYSVDRVAGFMFGWLSKNSDSIDVKSLQIDGRMAQGQDPEKMREKMLSVLEKAGVKDGKMTRDHYAQFLKLQMEERAEAEKKGDSSSSSSQGSSKSSGEDTEARAKESFKRMDSNNDGFLSAEEMQNNRRSNIYAEREKYDSNKDGKIEIKEYIEYYKSRDQRFGGNQGKGDRGSNNVPLEGDGPPQVDDKRPVVYRLGHLPKDLPKWYEELDKDKDAQVGLYEWKAGGKEIKDFLAIDANEDGFITVEEYLRYSKALVAKKEDAGGSPGKSATGFGNSFSKGGGGGGKDRMKGEGKGGGRFGGKRYGSMGGK